jgi:hypothetical protein
MVSHVLGPPNMDVITMGALTVGQLSATTIRGLQTQPQPLKRVKFLN